MIHTGNVHAGGIKWRYTVDQLLKYDPGVVSGFLEVQILPQESNHQHVVYISELARLLLSRTECLSWGFQFNCVSIVLLTTAICHKEKIHRRIRNMIFTV